MNKKPIIYYSHPIRGAAGKDASIAYMQNNCRRAKENVKLLREIYPEVDWYCPGEVDLIIQILYTQGKLTEDDILNADLEIIEKYCHGLFCHQWESSYGGNKEYDFAEENNIPRYYFKQLKLSNVDSEMLYKLIDFAAFAAIEREYKGENNE